MQSAIFIDTTLNGRQFSRGQIFANSGVNSALECSRRCLVDRNCQTFTYVPDGKDSGSCRAHDVTLTSQSPSTLSREEARTYRLNGYRAWLERNCSNNEDCPVPQSTCHHRYCLCQPGFFFSLSSRACLDACAEEKLQNSYIKYADPELAAVHDFNASTQGVIRLCQDICQDVYTAKRGQVCNAFIVRITAVHTNCHFAATTDLRNPDFDITGMYIFQRKCA
ncbi:hypothetical protein ACOMHN_027651 [Nucella lapillus]